MPLDAVRGLALSAIESPLQALRIGNSLPQIALFSKKIRQHVEHTPFFENTVMFRRDV